MLCNDLNNIFELHGIYDFKNSHNYCEIAKYVQKTYNYIYTFCATVTL